MKQKKIFITAVVLFVLAAGFYYSMIYQPEETEELFFVEDSSSNNPKVKKNNNEDEEKQAELKSKKKEKGTNRYSNTNEICVYVCGSVKCSGVYYLSDGKRISDAVKMAGGFSKKAAKEEINLAKELTDGEKVYIPSVNEMKQRVGNEQGFCGQKSEGEQPKVNINQAGPSDLTSLPGIGESKANAIIQYREEHGFFQQTDEIKKIEGIKDGVFNKIKDLITI